MEKKQNTERNNKGGRPPKSTTDKLKYRVTVKLATPDYYTLKSRARSAGISASEYLRECFRKGYVRQRLTAEHSDYIRKLCGMANNLNQLAHKANAGGFDTAKLECRVQVAFVFSYELIVVSFRENEPGSGEEGSGPCSCAESSRRENCTR